MFETTAVVAGLVAQEGFESLPRVGQGIPADEWRARTHKTRETSEVRNLLEQAPTEFGNIVETEFRIQSRADIGWRLAAESCAAGFPQLERLLIDPAEARKTEDHWVKLLVVDVGAGSTDAAYFVSSRSVTGQLFLNYLRPAATLEYAGEHLTEMLRSHYRNKGREITVEEAETIKLNAPDEWKDEPFVGDWRSRIAKHVEQYVRGLPDRLRLGLTTIPGLKIVLTGGSGLVEGLDRAVEKAVIAGLQSRSDVPTNVARRTEVVQLSVEWPPDPLDRARRAVSIGAGKHTFGQLRYRERFE